MRSPYVAKPMLVMAMLLATAVVAGVAKPSKLVSDDKPTVDLATMVPKAFAGWAEDTSIVPIQPPPEMQAVIDETYNQTLVRTYRNASGRRIMLSIAYGGAQHEGMNTHRPEICYPAQGFKIVRESEDGLIQTQLKPLPVRRLVALQGARNEPITYWLVVGDELTWFGIGHKLTTLKYGLTGRIPDGMLVRVSSIDGNVDEAFKGQELFVSEMIAALAPEHQARLLGAVQH